MTNVLDVSNELSEALRRLRDILGSSPATEQLSCRVPRYTADESDVASFPLQMAFVGQYSAGKSTLINALTGANLPTGAGVVTDKVVEVAWRGIRLIDTPGVETGTREEHDARARAAYEAADLIVFVTTTQLLDAAGHALFHELGGRQRKARQMVLVLNKAGRDSASPTALLEAAGQAISPHRVPVVLCDAEHHLLGLAETDAELRADLLADANLEGLRDALTRCARESGVLGRLATPARSAIDLCEEASLLAQDRSEEAEAKRVDIDRAHASLTGALQHLEEGAAGTANRLRRRIAELAEDPCALILDAVSDDASELSALLGGADERIIELQAEAVGALDELLESVKVRLAADERIIGDQGELAQLSARRRSIDASSAPSNFSALRREWSSELLATAKQGLSENFGLHLPTGSRPGGDLHRLVHRAKRLRHGSDIKPWSVVRAAETIEGLSESINSLSRQQVVRKMAGEAADFLIAEAGRVWGETKRKKQSDALRRSFEAAADASAEEFKDVVRELTGGLRDQIALLEGELTAEIETAEAVGDVRDELQALTGRFERLEALAHEL